MEEIIKLKVSKYTPIQSLLNIAIKEDFSYQSVYVKTMVHDAILLSENYEYRFKANRRMFIYSSYLSKHCVSIIRSMNPDNLTIEDYKKLLSLFDDYDI